MSFDYQALLETFLAESEERLGTVEQSLLALESEPGHGGMIHEVFRAMHTLKGDARTLGYGRLADLAHCGEDLLELVRNEHAELTSSVVSLLLDVVDVMRHLLATPPEAEEAPSGFAAVLEKLREAIRKQGAAPSTLPADGGVNSSAARTPGVEAYAEAAPQALRSIRVSLAKLDRLLDLVGEISVDRGRLRLALAAPGALTILDETEHLYRELQELVMGARLVPLGPIFRQQLRIARDVAAEQGKQIELMLDEHDVEVDARVLEEVRAPLGHLVRNAIDHGIEPPAIRIQKGKSPQGRLSLRAFHDAASVVIQVADDGAGLDRERILARAVERGLVEAAAELGDREVQRLVFAPGFSTAEQVTEVSGRGVGLDAVHRCVEALRGSAQIDSGKGTGTTVTLRLPLSLTIIDGFRVSVGPETYILPLDDVLECLDLPPGNDRGGAHGVFNLRGQPLPFLRLRHFFAVPEGERARESVLVVQHGRQKVGLVVDHLLGGGQNVVKPLAGVFRDLPGLFGTTVLGSGRLALVLDVAGVLEGALDFQGASAST